MATVTAGSGVENGVLLTETVADVLARQAEMNAARAASASQLGTPRS